MNPASSQMILKEQILFIVAVESYPKLVYGNML